VLVNLFGEARNRLHDVLTAIEHQQKVSVAERFEQQRSRIFDRNDQAKR
jgi:hypothetical protein